MKYKFKIILVSIIGLICGFMLGYILDITRNVPTIFPVTTDTTVYFGGCGIFMPEEETYYIK